MSSLPKRHWRDMTTEDFRDGDTANWIAVLPVAAIEQHGPHLPVSVDTTLAEGLLAHVEAALPPDLPVTFLPVQAIGKSNEHISSPGTLTFSYETLIRSWIEIGESVHRAGLNKIVIANSHGGNVPPLGVVVRELRVRHDMLAVAVGWSGFGRPPGLYGNEEDLYGIHGGTGETSMMLYLRPDLVRMDKAEDFRTIQLEMIEEFAHLRAHGVLQIGWKAQDLNPSGAAGDATAADAAKGEQIVRHQAKAFVELLQDVHRFDVARLWTAPTPGEAG